MQTNHQSTDVSRFPFTPLLRIHRTDLRPRLSWMLVVVAAMSVVAPGLAQPQPPGKNTSDTKPLKKLILPGESFSVGDQVGFIFWPEESKRQSPQPWIMYAPTLPGLPDHHEKWMHEQFLNAGVAVAGLDIGEAYGSPKGQAQYTAFYEHLTKNRGFGKKPCLLGRSRGGLLMSSWAISHPDKVAGLAGIYPVFDLRSYPGVNRAASAFDLSAEELAAQLPRLNPVARLNVLAERKIPAFLIHGDVDKVVPLEANSQALIQEYSRAGQTDLVTLEVAKGQGHNFWQGFFRCEGLIRFAIRTARSGTH